jgi:hypothetical protein
MLKQFIAALTSAVAIGVGFAGSAEAAHIAREVKHYDISLSPSPYGSNYRYLDFSNVTPWQRIKSGIDATFANSLGTTTRTAVLTGARLTGTIGSGQYFDCSGYGPWYTGGCSARWDTYLESVGEFRYLSSAPTYDYNIYGGLTFWEGASFSYFNDSAQLNEDKWVGQNRYVSLSFQRLSGFYDGIQGSFRLVGNLGFPRGPLVSRSPIDFFSNLKFEYSYEVHETFIAAPPKQPTESVPEPASLLGLAAIGTAAVGGALKKKKTAA